MDQTTFSDLEYQNKKKKTRREVFLERMDALIPWDKLERKIRPHYPRKRGNRGRTPYPLPVMLRVHCVQLFYNVSDPAMEDMLYEIESVRRFVGLKITGPIPDETTILKFRHLLERHSLGETVLETINEHLAEQDLMLREGTIIDASIIAAPSSTKNQSGQRDPEMHQAKKGKDWHFGMKMHIGVDEVFGLTHSLVTTAANVHDLTVAPDLLHGDESAVWADAGYRGAEKRSEHADRAVEWNIGLRPGQRRKLEPGGADDKHERCKASMRAKVEHPFLYVKRIFGYSKVRYRGLHKNTQRIAVLIGFANLLRAERYLAV